MYADAVIDFHQEFDVEDFAGKFFDLTKQCLIILERGSKRHWHIHGTWIGDRKAYKEYFHPDRKGHGRQKTRPVRVALDKDEQGFQYICKESPPNVVKQWHITDEQIAEWHIKSEEYKADKDRKMKRWLSEVPQSGTPSEYFRALKRVAYNWTLDEGKLIHPARLNSYVVTCMYGSSKDAYKAWILDNK